MLEYIGCINDTCQAYSSMWSMAWIISFKTTIEIEECDYALPNRILLRGSVSLMTLFDKLFDIIDDWFTSSAFKDKIAVE